MSACNEGERSGPPLSGTPESHIDITFASASIRHRVNNWEVLETESLSLHKYIRFNVNAGTHRLTPRHRNGWAFTRIDKHLHSMVLTMTTYHPMPSGTIDEETEQLANWTTKAAEKCKHKSFDNRRPAHWWNEDNAQFRKDCLKARRIFQRKRQ